MKQRVLHELDRIERQHKIRNLLAVESGSTAWGFASPDSDYDVRFIYAHERDWYLSVLDVRDVMEEMMPDRLDFSGWDLRKTLRLFSKCNLALNEWLGSPVVYAEALEFRHRLLKLIPCYFNPVRAVHHYRSMADRAITGNLVDGRIQIKMLFYVLRPLLACRWIQHTGTQPPTEFEELMTPAWVTTDERGWIANLLEQKSMANEAQPFHLDQRRADSIRSELDRYKSSSEPAATPSKSSTVELDQVFRDWIVQETTS